jgi:pilus assembly protein Flp/PilA
MSTLESVTSADADDVLAPADEERGQGLAEYALILALIAIVAIVALIFLGGQISKIISEVGGSV